MTLRIGEADARWMVLSHMPRPSALDLRCVKSEGVVDEDSGEATPDNASPGGVKRDVASEVVLEVVTKVGERLGLDLADLPNGGLEIRTNTIGAKPGSRLLKINNVDVRKASPEAVSAMLHEADGVVELRFAATRPKSARGRNTIGNPRMSLLARLTGARTSSKDGDDESLL